MKGKKILGVKKSDLQPVLFVYQPFLSKFSGASNTETCSIVILTYCF